MAEKKPKTAELKRVDITLEYDTEIGGQTIPAGKTVPVWPDQAEFIQKMHAARKQAEAAQEIK